MTFDKFMLSASVSNKKIDSKCLREILTVTEAYVKF